MVNNTLRKEYEKLHEEINESKSAFLRLMKQQSGSTKDLGNEIAIAFMPSAGEEDFYLALDRVRNEIKEQKDAPFADLSYDSIFDDKVLTALDNRDFKAAIDNYITRYNELLSVSQYFKQGTFEYYNASQIAKALEDNGFFTAKHTITLNDASERVEITTRAQLEALIAKELDKITEDKELKKKFDTLKKLLEKNAALRDFRAYLSANQLLLPHLKNINLFKQQIWKSYFKKHESAYEDAFPITTKLKLEGTR